MSVSFCSSVSAVSALLAGLTCTIEARAGRHKELNSSTGVVKSVVVIKQKKCQIIIPKASSLHIDRPVQLRKSRELTAVARILKIDSDGNASAKIQDKYCSENWVGSVVLDDQVTDLSQSLNDDEDNDFRSFLLELLKDPQRDFVQRTIFGLGFEPVITDSRDGTLLQTFIVGYNFTKSIAAEGRFIKSDSTLYRDPLDRSPIDLTLETKVKIYHILSDFFLYYPLYMSSGVGFRTQDTFSESQITGCPSVSYSKSTFTAATTSAHVQVGIGSRVHIGSVFCGIDYIRYHPFHFIISEKYNCLAELDDLSFNAHKERVRDNLYRRSISLPTLFFGLSF